VSVNAHHGFVCIEDKTVAKYLAVTNMRLLFLMRATTLFPARICLFNTIRQFIDYILRSQFFYHSFGEKSSRRSDYGAKEFGPNDKGPYSQQFMLFVTNTWVQ
jgi:hypothetical protein